MTCKDCIHQDVCEHYHDSLITNRYVVDCHFAKNKADVQKALEKQIPKKPLKEADIIGERGDSFLFTNRYCPNCLSMVKTHGKYGLPLNRDKYCSHCGQALDWSD